jgi:conjugative transfer region protein TrbK
MRLRPVNIAAIARVAGYVAVAAVIAAAALHFWHAGAGAQVATHSPVQQNDPLAAKLLHCQSIGMAAQDDKACALAWAENRRRFFTYQPTSYPQTERPSIQRPHDKPEGQ